MAEQWTDERIEQEINKAARELIVYDTKLAIYVVPQVRRVALDIFADMGTALDAANAKIAEYERELPQMENGRYTVTTDHRFNDDGICIRCGEDAEEWDAGCVESIVNDVLDANQRIAELEAQLGDWRPIEEDYWGHINVEREGTVISVMPSPFMERDKGYVIVPLPNNIRLCRRKEAGE